MGHRQGPTWGCSSNRKQVSGRPCAHTQRGRVLPALVCLPRATLASPNVLGAALALVEVISIPSLLGLSSTPTWVAICALGDKSLLRSPGVEQILCCGCVRGSPGLGGGVCAESWSLLGRARRAFQL